MNKKAPVRGQRTATNKAVTAAGSAIAGPSPAMERKWQAQDDLRTLQRAAEIKGDPKRVKAAQAEAQQQMKALQTVTKK